MAAKNRKLDDRPPPPVPMESHSRWDISTVFVWVVCGYVLLLPLAGAALTWGFSLPRGQEVTQDRIRFMVVNALTLTGFQGNIDTSRIPWPCAIVLLALTLLGTLTALFLGGLAAARILHLPISDTRILRGSVMLGLGLTLVTSLPLLDDRTGPMQAWMLSTSALGNSGAHIGGLPSAGSWKSQLILLPLAVLGGLGLPVLMELPGLLWGRRAASEHTRCVLGTSAAVYLGALVILFLIRLAAGGTLSQSLVSASTTAINSRSAGFPWEYAQSFPRQMQWLAMLLMLAGAGPAGTAGGIGLTTLDRLARGIRSALRGEAPGRPFGLAATWVAIYVATSAIFFFVLLFTNADMRADVLLLETISAVGNVGISFNPVIMVSPGLDVLTAAMLAGRLLPLGFLWWLAAREQRMAVLIG